MALIAGTEIMADATHLVVAPHAPTVMSTTQPLKVMLLGTCVLLVHWHPRHHRVPVIQRRL